MDKDPRRGRRRKERGRWKNGGKKERKGDRKTVSKSVRTTKRLKWTFCDILGHFGRHLKSLERLDYFPSHFRPSSLIIGSLKKKAWRQTDGPTDGQTLLKRCEDASKNWGRSQIIKFGETPPKVKEVVSKWKKGTEIVRPSLTQLPFRMGQTFRIGGFRSETVRPSLTLFAMGGPPSISSLLSLLTNFFDFSLLTQRHHLFLI